MSVTKRNTRRTKMEKEQIVKALEFCTDDNSICLHCPVRGRCNDDSMFLEKAALSLIREQEKRIEELTLEYAGFEAGAKDAANFIKYATVRKMVDKIMAKSEYGMINISPWQLDQIAKEVLEEQKCDTTEKP